MLRLALIAMLIAGIPVLGAGDVSAAPGKTKAEKSASRKGEKKWGNKSEDWSTRGSPADSWHDHIHSKKERKKKEPTTVATPVRHFNRTVYTIARRSAEWVTPSHRFRHYDNSYDKPNYRPYPRSRLHRRGCSVAAKKRFGAGRRLRGISAHRYGKRACHRAIKKCRRQLRRHQSYGRNPYARCVIVYRR